MKGYFEEVLQRSVAKMYFEGLLRGGILKGNFVSADLAPSNFL